MGGAFARRGHYKADAGNRFRLRIDNLDSGVPSGTPGGGFTGYAPKVAIGCAVPVVRKYGYKCEESENKNTMERHGRRIRSFYACI
jgi:hypothetical protein